MSDNITISSVELAAKLGSNSSLIQYSKAIAEASLANIIEGYSVERFAWGLAAIGHQETLWGLSRDLDRQGPSGTGDFAARTGRWLRAPNIVIVSELTGKWRSSVSGPWAVPFDERGWGRGLLQEDWGSNSDWLTSNDWTDPSIAIARAAWRYRQLLIEASLIEQQAFDGYNEGIGRVEVDLKAGLDPDSTTTGGNYGGRCLEILNSWSGSLSP